jgi:fatty-acyl-CoA synthase
MQYIGELCRYLLHAPPNPNDGNLSLRYAIGNGLRSEIWIPFQERFRIGRIIEFYSATEANVALLNSSGKVGSLGCVPRVIDFVYPVRSPLSPSPPSLPLPLPSLSSSRILRVNPEKKDEPLRDAQGHCISADYDEAGLVVCLVNNKLPISRFDGYSDSEASKKKILTNVFHDGDMYFNSGDLLRRDWFGFFFWSDRVGDTFRWKGENVATTEVRSTIPHPDSWSLIPWSG